MLVLPVDWLLWEWGHCHCVCGRGGGGGERRHWQAGQLYCFIRDIFRGPANWRRTTRINYTVYLIGQVGQIMLRGQGTLMTKMKSAYRIVPSHPSDCPLLVFFCSGGCSTMGLPRKRDELGSPLPGQFYHLRLSRHLILQGSG